MSLLDAALKRLQAIDIAVPEREKYRRSNRYLIYEHLRRCNVWMAALDYHNYGGFTDIPKLVAPDMQLTEVVNQSFYELKFTRFERSMCQMYLLTNMIIDEGKLPTKLMTLPDLYEPMILILERGGRMTQEHSIVDMNYVGVLYRKWINIDIPKGVQNLDIAYLDQMDLEGTL